ncbi:MAG TPA: phosphoglycerate kinase [Lentisphaeria bacterium]|nr:MAG: phosphoglycerate kinase [Lentisphaerae bacterium GWF2_50_93]HCE43006.1 phosphoglycerate kinase [Lentisphaeria bacterium]
MGLNKKTVRDVELKGKRVVMRVDFNVPVKEGKIKDDTRIRAAVPTIKYVLDKGASLVLLSHLGRPDGEVKPEFSLKPTVDVLSKLIGKPVQFVDDCIGEKAVAAAKALKPGELMICENTRFHIEEDMKAKTDEDKAKTADFAKELAKLGDVYVNDAFGTAHRSHGSTAKICKYIPISVAGFLMEKEIQYLGQTVENPKRPFVAIIGGAKISGKLEVLTSLISKCDAILIGGGMAYTFLKAQGHNIGKSLCEDELIDTAKQILAEAKKKNVTFLLPIDNLSADKFDNAAQIKTVGNDIAEGWMALDIGPKTVASYTAEIMKAKTIVWNGPMGCFEMPNFAKGTMAICKAVADASDKGAISVIGGGDSVSAVNQSGLAGKMSHISTGGGASLEFLEGKQLPGVVALNDM